MKFNIITDRLVFMNNPEGQPDSIVKDIDDMVRSYVEKVRPAPVFSCHYSIESKALIRHCLDSCLCIIFVLEYYRVACHDMFPLPITF